MVDNYIFVNKIGLMFATVLLNIFLFIIFKSHTYMKKVTQMLMSAVVLTIFGWTTPLCAQTVSAVPAVITTTLVDVLAISVTQPAVPLVFATAADYQNGVSVPVPAHVTVSSNRPYDLKVQAVGDLTTAGQTPRTIPIGNVFVQVTANTAPLASINAAARQALSNSIITLTNSSDAAMADAITVTYSTDPGNRNFMNTGVYTANLTYSVTAH